MIEESKEYLDLIETTIDEVKNSCKNNLNTIKANLEPIKVAIENDLQGDEKIILMSAVVRAIS
ncbi:hypothetical protein ACFSQP_00275 [Bizionia sediminis]|uniref:Uncharacterized protein n=1 Tax=Bizionia sediminis TaxID=1737064 RepID=A0ABW5KR63_9FLAO